MILTSTFGIDPIFLNELAVKHHKEYSQAKPFPHIVIDNFLPEFILEEILKEFPKPGAIDWQKFENPSEKKLGSQHELEMGEMTRSLLYQLNSSVFVKFLETLTGINGLIPDPHFFAGGLHQIERGGYMKVHVDFNQNSKLRLDHRLNFLLYLNQDWKEEYGGHLELWDKDVTTCVKKILPIFNRFIVFNSTESSYHGHPEPLTCPEGETRKSLALYYYTNGRPAEEISNYHSSVFKARPGEKLSNITAKTILKKIIPPILIDIKKLMENMK